MSGHSHWHSIRHQKGVADAKKSKIFSKISRTITIAARDGGGDPEVNPKLRMLLDQAKEANLPKDTVERAIKRGTGELQDQKLEEFLFEAYGPGGIGIIIDGITDNKNRTFGDVRQILNQNKGKLVESGVKWLFERKGVIFLSIEGQNANKEEMEIKAIEAGAEDLKWNEENSELEIYTQPEKSSEVKENLEKTGLKPERTGLGWVAKEEISVSEHEKQEAEKLFEALDENDSVQEIYSNLK